MDDKYRKSRMVSFRLSESEYETAEELRKSCGWQSMSYFARSALLSQCGTAASQSSELPALAAIRERIYEVAEEVYKILSSVGSTTRKGDPN